MTLILSDADIETLLTMPDCIAVLEDADVHDLRDSKTTRELYVLDTRLHGVHSNRKRVFVDREQITSISALDDVME